MLFKKHRFPLKKNSPFLLLLLFWYAHDYIHFERASHLIWSKIYIMYHAYNSIFFTLTYIESRRELVCVSLKILRFSSVKLIAIASLGSLIIRSHIFSVNSYYCGHSRMINSSIWCVRERERKIKVIIWFFSGLTWIKQTKSLWEESDREKTHMFLHNFWFCYYHKQQAWIYRHLALCRYTVFGLDFMR